jgi:predicted transposase/invertase (TIGR01784 family)
MRARYVNPFTDFGFKKIFGEEASKPVLMDFLNALLPEHHRIVELSFKNTEQLGTTDLDRKAVFDIYCESSTGEKFIVELQKAKQNYFIDRTVYYSTFPIREQADKGNWNYNLKAVYCIGILDFTFNDYDTEPERHEVVHTIKLKDQHGKVFYDKLTYIYLELPNFTMPAERLETRLEQWLYFIKHLEDFETIPAIFSDAVFAQALETAAIASFRVADLDQYEASLKVFRDNKATYDYAVETAWDNGLQRGLQQGLEQGLEQGIQEGIQSVAKALKAQGIATAVIVASTGLSAKDIDAL